MVWVAGAAGRGRKEREGGKLREVTEAREKAESGYRGERRGRERLWRKGEKGRQDAELKARVRHHDK